MPALIVDSAFCARELEALLPTSASRAPAAAVERALRAALCRGASGALPVASPLRARVWRSLLGLPDDLDEAALSARAAAVACDLPNQRVVRVDAERTRWASREAARDAAAAAGGDAPPPPAPADLAAFHARVARLLTDKHMSEIEAIIQSKPEEYDGFGGAGARELDTI